MDNPNENVEPEKDTEQNVDTNVAQPVAQEPKPAGPMYTQAQVTEMMHRVKEKSTPDDKVSELKAELAKAKKEAEEAEARGRRKVLIEEITKECDDLPADYLNADMTEEQLNDFRSRWQAHDEAKTKVVPVQKKSSSLVEGGW